MMYDKLLKFIENCMSLIALQALALLSFYTLIDCNYKVKDPNLLHDR